MSLAVPSVVSISGAPFRVGIAAARFNPRKVVGLDGYNLEIVEQVAV